MLAAENAVAHGYSASFCLIGWKGSLKRPDNSGWKSHRWGQTHFRCCKNYELAIARIALAALNAVYRLIFDEQ